jgi:peptide/nickel transport system substrate-binding protein
MTDSEIDSAHRILSKGHWTRRRVLKYGIATATVSLSGALLASCGGGDDDIEGSSTPTPQTSASPLPGTPRTSDPIAAVTPTPLQRPPIKSVTPTTTPEANPTEVDPTGVATAPTETPAAATEEPVDPDRPRSGGTLVLQVGQEITSLHPDDAAPVAHWVAVTSIHDALVRVGPDFALEPVIATSYEVANDGRSFTFQLRDDIRFHDGEPLDAADVGYTFDYFRDPANGTLNHAGFRNIAAVDTPGAYSVTVLLSQPDVSFLPQGASMPILPQHVHSAVGKAGYATQPVGTGPFRLRELDPQRHVILDAVEDARGRPHIDTLRIEVVASAEERLGALMAGRSHHSVAALAPQDNDAAVREGRFLVYQAPGVALNHIPLNNEHPPLADKVVRQAMMYAIDRPRLVNVIEFGQAVIATANLSPAIEAYYEPEVAAYPYDPELARAMLDEHGWRLGEDGIRSKDGMRLSFTCTVIAGDDRRRPQADLIQVDLRGVGIEMLIEEAPVSTIIAQMSRQGVEIQASMFTWTYGGIAGDPDARASLRSDGPRNFSHYRNGRIDELLDAGVSTADYARRREMYREVQRIVADDVPFLFLMFWTSFSIWSSHVRGLPESVSNPQAVYAYLRECWLDGD